MEDVREYLHLYLGHEVFVQKRLGNDNLVRGRICEVTHGSNHGDWIRVVFDTCHTFMYHNFHQRTSNFHDFFMEEDFIKLISNRLSSMDDSDVKEFCRLEGWGENLENIVVTDSAIEFTQNERTQAVSRFTRLRPQTFVWLLSKGFWLFGNEAFDKGLIIDSKTLNKEA